MLAPGPSDPDLARVAAAWPSLPAPIRAAVLALVAAAAPGFAQTAAGAAEATSRTPAPAGDAGGPSGAMGDRSAEDRP